MKGLLKGFAAFAVVAAVAAVPAQAQGVTFGLGGGVSLPLGDFGDGSKMGFNGQASVGFSPASLPVGIQIDGNFLRFGVDAEDVDASTQVLAGTANAVYNFSTAETSTFKPYLIGGLGMYNSKLTGDDVPDGFDASSTDFGVNAGAGFNFMAGSLGAFVEGRFHNVFTEESSTNLVNLTVGVRFGGGA